MFVFIFLIEIIHIIMSKKLKHSNHIFRATATLLLLLLCVSSAVAREKNRAIALPFEDSVYNFRMLYEYDSWNRVQRIVYPDSEVVSYNYDLARNPVATNLQPHLPRYCPICRKKMHESTIHKWYCKRQLIILC